MTPPVLSVRHVNKTFRDGKRDVEALSDISFDLFANEFVSLVGASGCGKSTLLAIIAGLEEQSAGEVLVDGVPISGPGRDRGVVFQTYTLFPWLTARQNIQFALTDKDLTAAQRRGIADQHLEQVGLAKFADAYPAKLSGGMRQRVAMARALCYQPRILLMDEPFGALDAHTRIIMQELLIEIWERHRLTVVFVTHDIEEAVFLSDRVLLMGTEPGRIREDVPVNLQRPRTYELLASPELLARRSYLFEAIRSDSTAVRQVGR